MLVGNIFIYVVGRYLKKPLIELTTLAKISCKLFSYGVIPDPFLDLRSSKIEQMKGIDAMKKKYMPGGNFVVPVGGRYLKKASYFVD